MRRRSARRGVGVVLASLAPREGVAMSSIHHRVGLLIATIALAGALAPAAPQPVDPNKALAQEQLKLAQQALKDLDLLYKNGEVTLYDPRFTLWMRRRVEAILASGADKAEIVAALEGNVKRLRELESVTETAFQKEQL